MYHTEHRTQFRFPFWSHFHISETRLDCCQFCNKNIKKKSLRLWDKRGSVAIHDARCLLHISTTTTTTTATMSTGVLPLWWRQCERGDQKNSGGTQTGEGGGRHEAPRPPSRSPVQCSPILPRLCFPFRQQQNDDRHKQKGVGKGGRGSGVRPWTTGGCVIPTRGPTPHTREQSMDPHAHLGGFQQRL